MEEKAVVDAVKLRIIRRQTMSRENHIRRIRSATAIRMLESLPDVFEAIPSQNLNVCHSHCYFNSRRKSHQNHVQTEFWEELNKNKIRRSLAGNRRIRKNRKKSSTALYPGNTRTHFLGNIKFNFKDELEESLADKEYLVPKIPFASEDYDFSCAQDSEELFDNKEFFQCKDSSEGKKINFRRNIGKTSDEEGVLKLKSPLSSENNVSHTEDELNEMYTNKAICTAEAISSSKEGKCASNEGSVDSTPHAQKDQTHSKTQIIKLIFDASFSVEIERRASKEKIIRINSQTQENRTDSTVEFKTHAPNTEIRVSEIGKLQITFDSKIISPKDAPIVIRADDNPETLPISDCNTRSSVTSESYAKRTEYPTEVIGSVPESKRINARKLKTDSDLPFAAKKSNNAAFSKFKMKSLSTLFKRNDLGQNFNFPNN